MSPHAAELLARVEARRAQLVAQGVVDGPPSAGLAARVANIITPERKGDR